MDQDRRRLLGRRQKRLELFLPRAHSDQVVLDQGAGHAVLDGLNKPVPVVAKALELLAISGEDSVTLGSQVVQLTPVLVAELGARLRVHQVGAQGAQHRLLELGLMNGLAVVARPFVACRRAAVALEVDHAKAAAAAAALEQVRKELAWPLLSMEGTASVQLLLPRLGLLPDVLVDDPQLGHLLTNPFLFGIDPRHAPACVRVLHEALPIPDQLADVEFVVQYPVAAATVAVDRALAPLAAARRRDVLAIQLRGDVLWGSARDELTEDAPNDSGFCLVDRPVAAYRFAARVERFHGVVAIADTAAGLALLDASAQSSSDLDGKVFEEEGVHRAFEADVQLGNQTFGQGKDADAAELEALLDCGDVRLVAAHPVESFGNNAVELSELSVLHQHLYAGPHHAGSGDPVIGIDADDFPAFFRRARLAKPYLILDRSIALKIRRVTGIDGNAHGYP